MIKRSWICVRRVYVVVGYVVLCWSGRFGFFFLVVLGGFDEISSKGEFRWCMKIVFS